MPFRGGDDVFASCIIWYTYLYLENPNCVVLGDAVEKFTYENLNKAFRSAFYSLFTEKRK